MNKIFETKGELRYFVKGDHYVVSPSTLTKLILDFDYSQFLQNSPMMLKAREEGKAFGYDLQSFLLENKITDRIKSIVKEFERRKGVLVNTEPLLYSKTYLTMGYLDAECTNADNHKILLEFKYRSTLQLTETDKLRFVFHSQMVKEMYASQNYQLELGMVQKKTGKIKVFSQRDIVRAKMIAKADNLLNFYNYGIRPKVEKANRNHPNYPKDEILFS